MGRLPKSGATCGLIWRRVSRIRRGSLSGGTPAYDASRENVRRTHRILHVVNSGRSPAAARLLASTVARGSTPDLRLTAYDTRESPARWRAPDRGCVRRPSAVQQAGKMPNTPALRPEPLPP